MKKLIVITLIMAFLLSVVPVNALAANDTDQEFCKPVFEPESIDNHNMYMVVDQYVAVRSEPNNSAEVTKRLNAGAFIYVEPVKNDKGNIWYRVKEIDSDGYIYSSHLKIHNHIYKEIYNNANVTLSFCECGGIRIDEEKERYEYNAWDLIVEAIAGNWAPTQTAMGMMAHAGVVSLMEKIPKVGGILAAMYAISDTSASIYQCLTDASCDIVGIAINGSEAIITRVVPTEELESIKPFWENVERAHEVAQQVKQFAEEVNGKKSLPAVIPVKDLDRELQELIIESVIEENK